MSTAESLQIDLFHVKHQPVVEKRIAAAESPVAFPTLIAWLRSAVRVRGFPAQLAAYCDVSRQNVEKWTKEGSIPANPEVHKKIADWAQVPYQELRDLIDRDRTARALTPKAQRAKGFARNKSPSRVREHSRSLRINKPAVD